MQKILLKEGIDHVTFSLKTETRKVKIKLVLIEPR